MTFWGKFLLAIICAYAFILFMWHMFRLTPKKPRKPMATFIGDNDNDNDNDNGRR